VQDPFSMGWAGVHAVAATWSGEEVKPRIDTGCGVITRENMDTPESKRLLDPPIDEYLE
jgi:ribose transport system substrate-binding protein